MKAQPLIVHKHEVCECGHCRCDHSGGFMECTVCTKNSRKRCARYSWPGLGADLPPDHRRRRRLKVPQ